MRSKTLIYLIAALLLSACSTLQSKGPFWPQINPAISEAGHGWSQTSNCRLPSGAYPPVSEVVCIVLNNSQRADDDLSKVMERLTNEGWIKSPNPTQLKAFPKGTNDESIINLSYRKNVDRGACYSNLYIYEDSAKADRTVVFVKYNECEILA